MMAYFKESEDLLYQNRMELRQFYLALDLVVKFLKSPDRLLLSIHYSKSNTELAQ